MDNSTLKNTSYLHFDAFSIKDAIVNKLSESANFTDQIYDGSNLSVIIDLVSVVFQSLMYTLNNTASETMFADTAIYENITRLVKFLNYTPRGYTTSTVTCNVTNINPNQDAITIPAFSTINLGKYDINGNPIYYSTKTSQTIYMTTNEKQTITLYNGRWKLYSTVFTSKGTANEIFSTTIASNENTQQYVDYSSLTVYIKKPDGTFSKGTRTEHINTLYVSPKTTKLYYEIVLDEYKQYNIKFGDGINVPVIPYGSEIYLFYLDTNGPNGLISENELTGLQLVCSPQSLGVTNDVFYSIFPEDSSLNLLQYIRLGNSSKSSATIIEETVESIRANAPQVFSEGNRVVTTEDTKAWLMRNFPDDILDCVVQNNWEYITGFYAWLYNIGKQVYNNGKEYIQPNILSKHDLAYTDAADSNTTYAWIKTYADGKIPQDNIITSLDVVKPLTSNIVLMKPLNVHFALCLANEDYVKTHYLDNTIFDANNENYIEVTVDDDLRYSPIRIKNEIKIKIISFFAESNFELGSKVDINKLYSDIMDIPGVLRLRTVFEPKSDDILEYDIVAKQGLSFASWTADIIKPSDDLDITTSYKQLEYFQFPVLDTKDFDNKIKIITSNQNVTLKY